MKTAFIYNDIYRNSIFSKNHPITNNRISNVFDLAKIINFKNIIYFYSQIATYKELLIFHDKEYIDILRQTEKTQKISQHNKIKYNLGTFSNPIFKEMFRRHAVSTGSLILAANLIINNKLNYVFSPGSGAHHGKKNKADGFCYFNDIATCILHLKKNNIKRIVYFDMDAHYGDGVVESFKKFNDVLTISLHQKDLWPRNGNYIYTNSLINLPLEHGFNDIDFKKIFEKKIENKIYDFNPQVVLLQMGADCLIDDYMSKLCLSNNAMAFVIKKFKKLSKNIIVMGGGGYNPWTTLRAWIYNLAALSDELDLLQLKPEAKSFLEKIKWKAEPKNEWTQNICDAPNIFD